MKEDNGGDYLVAEAVREKKRDDQDALMKKIIPALTVFTVAACVVMAASLYANLFYRDAQQALGDRLHEAALEATEGKPSAKEKLEALTKEADPAYRLMASAALAARGELQLPAGEAPSSEERGPVRQALRLANRNTAPEELSSFLKLASFYQAFAVSEKTDYAKRAELESALEKAAAAEGKDGPWAYSYRELRGLMLLEQGKEAEAGKIFSDLSQDADTPENMRKRAKDLLKVLNGSGAAAAPEGVQTEAKS